MSLTTKRTISWLGTLAVLAAFCVGIARLPASGGLVDELRWALGRARGSPASFDHAERLLFAVAHEGLGDPLKVLETLLADEDPFVVHGTLVHIADEFRVLTGLTQGFEDEPPPAVIAFRTWFDRTTPDERLAYLPNTLLAGAALPEGWQMSPVLTRDDGRWIVAAALERNPDWRTWADRLLFGRADALEDQRTRLLVLDRLEDCDPGPDWPGLQCRYPDEPYALHGDDVAAYISDPHEKARWAAGRILTVARDARGLPAFREWLTAHPRIPSDAEKMLTDLFGPDWRKSP
jgi:hypothetical protein